MIDRQSKHDLTPRGAKAEITINGLTYLRDLTKEQIDLLLWNWHPHPLPLPATNRRKVAP